MSKVHTAPDGWIVALAGIETKDGRIRIECECSACGGTGLWRDDTDPSIAKTCTTCRGGGRSIVYLKAWTGRKRLEGVRAVCAHEHVPALPYEEWLEAVVPNERGAVEYRLEGVKKQ